MFYAVLVILGALGSVLLWVNTPWGIGVGYDSMFYLSAARNLVDGLGLSRSDGFGNLIPLTHYPPLYPIVLAFFHWLSRTPVDLVARILAAGLFGINVALIGWLVYHFTGSTLAGGLGALLAISSPVLIDVHLMAMSEPPYLLVILLLLGALSAYLANGNERTLALAGLLAGTAYLARYVGASAAGAGGLAVLVLGRKPWSRRVKDAVLFGLVAAVVMVAWYLRNSLLTGGGANRAFLFHPPTAAQLRQGLVTISLWLLPPSVPGLWRLLFAALVVLALVGAAVYAGSHLRTVAAGGGRIGRAWIAAVLLALFILAYVVLLGSSLTFFDASTRLNDRILFPMYILGMILALVILWAAIVLQGSRGLRYAAVLASILLIGVNFVRSQGLLAVVREEGLGFNSRAWRSSATIQALRELPENTLIYSNEAFPINFLTGRPANWVPERIDLVKGQVVVDYPAKLREMHQTLAQQDGALVLFDTNLSSGSYPPIAELADDLMLWKTLEDGWIYLSPQ